jgi:hypothetical protein
MVLWEIWHVGQAPYAKLGISEIFTGIAAGTLRPTVHPGCDGEWVALMQVGVREWGIMCMYVWHCVCVCVWHCMCLMLQIVCGGTDVLLGSSLLGMHAAQLANSPNICGRCQGKFVTVGLLGALCLHGYRDEGETEGRTREVVGSVIISYSHPRKCDR